jgi:hypothetical protein
VAHPSESIKIYKESVAERINAAYTIRTHPHQMAKRLSFRSPEKVNLDTAQYILHPIGIAAQAKLRYAHARSYLDKSGDKKLVFALVLRSY